MLVLARLSGQSIVLDGGITITVLATRGGTVRLGIDAPPEVGVRRGELAVIREPIGQAGVAGSEAEPAPANRESMGTENCP
ncbi:MAG: carbon storage regulator [Actinomycetes bacterium]